MTDGERIMRSILRTEFSGYEFTITAYENRTDIRIVPDTDIQKHFKTGSGDIFVSVSSTATIEETLNRVALVICRNMKIQL